MARWPWILGGSVGLGAALYHLIRSGTLEVPGVGLGEEVVPKEQRWAEGYVLGQPKQILLQSIGGGHWLVPEAADAFDRMREAAAADGIELHVNSSFRTTTQQRILYSEKGDIDASGSGGVGAKKVGYSPHQRGVAVDVSVARDSRVDPWLGAHAHEFNFVRTAPNEPWHLAYGGMGYGL